MISYPLDNGNLFQLERQYVFMKVKAPHLPEAYMYSGFRSIKQLGLLLVRLYSIG